MNEYEEKYTALLKYFNTYTFYDNLLATTSYVSIDNIHDAILNVGLSMEQPLNFYIVRAKQYALNGQRDTNNRSRIIIENFDKTVGGDIDFDILNEYGFIDEELELINELLSGIKCYKSKIPRRQYKKILDNIKAKIIASQ